MEEGVGEETRESLICTGGGLAGPGYTSSPAVP